MHSFHLKSIGLSTCERSQKKTVSAGKGKGEVVVEGRGGNSLYKDSAETSSLNQTSAGSAPFSDKYKDDLDTICSAQVCARRTLL